MRKQRRRSAAGYREADQRLCCRYIEQNRTEHNFYLKHVSVHTQVEYEKNEYIKQNTCTTYITWELFCIYMKVDMIDADTCTAQFRNIYNIAECTLH